MGTKKSKVEKNIIMEKKRIHILNIPFRYRNEDLYRMFQPFGKVKNAEVIFNEKGSKGFGFVTIEGEDSANKAKEELHGSIIEGRKIEVNDANVHIQQRKPKTRVQSVLPMVVGGTTHYTMPYVFPQQVYAPMFHQSPEIQMIYPQQFHQFT